MYLELEVVASYIHRGFPTPITLGIAENLWDLEYGTITLYGAPFQETSSRPVGFNGNPNHIRLIFLQDVQFALYRVRSPLLTASRLISFPSLTKMFQFREFPFQ